MRGRVPPHLYSLGSLRGGGAVADFVAGRPSLTDLMFHGRWDCPRSLSHDLQMGLATLAATRLPTDSAALVTQLAALLPALLPALSTPVVSASVRRFHSRSHRVSCVQAFLTAYRVMLAGRVRLTEDVVPFSK